VTWVTQHVSLQKFDLAFIHGIDTLHIINKAQE